MEECWWIVTVFMLPLEVWVDIFSFPWITRDAFGQLVDRIGNRKFAEFMQFYLHEWGKHKLNDLVFKKNGLYVRRHRGARQIRVDFPQTPIPENIKFFGSIGITHFDAKTLDFLDKIRPLLTNVDIGFDMLVDNPADLRTILTNLAPSLDGIHSLHCCLRKHINVAVLKELKPPYSHSNAVLDEGALIHVNILMDWLNSLSIDGPRMCEIKLYSDERILMTIHQEFLAATTQCTFAIILDLFWGLSGDFRLENGIGEVLHGEWKDGKLHIIRHPANSSTEQMREWIWAMTKEKAHGTIQIYNPTFGSLAAAPVDVPPADEEEQDDQQQQQPSCFCLLLPKWIRKRMQQHQ